MINWKPGLCTKCCEELGNNGHVCNKKKTDYFDRIAEEAQLLEETREYIPSYGQRLEDGFNATNWEYIDSFEDNNHIHKTFNL